MRGAVLALALLALAASDGCDSPPTTDQVQQQSQETILAELNAKAGMPAIRNGRERKLLKSILELRDQDGLITYTYTYAENTGKRIFLCQSIGYGIPYATEYTSPQKAERLSYPSGSYYVEVLPQADPNGLFSPASAEGTWVMCKDPNGPDVKPVYIEPRIIVSPFPLPEPVQEIPVAVTSKGAK